MGVLPCPCNQCRSLSVGYSLALSLGLLYSLAVGRVLTGSTPGQTSLTFVEFLHGMAAVKQDSRCADWLNLHLPNKMKLLSLIIDTPVNEMESKRILDSLSLIERAGIKILMQYLLTSSLSRSVNCAAEMTELLAGVMR